MADDTTVLTRPAATPTPAAGAAAPAASGTPNAKPEGDKPAPAGSQAPAKPDGGAQEPTKPADTTTKPPAADGTKPTAPAAAAAAAAPEEWKLSDLKPPEGMTIDPAIGEKFTKTIQDKTLSEKDRAQRLIDLQSEVTQKAVNDSLAQWKEATEAWKKEALKELGPEPEKELAYGKAWIDKFGGDELRKVLDDSGLGNHPALVRAIVKAGKAMTDTFIEGNQPKGGQGEKTVAEILYPNLPKG